MAVNELKSLKAQMRRYEELREQESQLLRNITTMESMLPDLKYDVEKQQGDVDNLENGGIMSMFFSAIGRHEEKLEKERNEARAAAVKYQDALQTCQDLHRQLEDVKDQLSTLGNCEERFRTALRSKQERIMAGNSPAAQRLRTLAAEAVACQDAQREIREAIVAGEQVLVQITKIEETLRSASNWGTFDLFSDSFISDVVKYGKIDDAKRQMQQLNGLLNSYAKELRDLDLRLNLSTTIGSGMQFADFLFDGFITDSIALDKINRMRDEVSEIRRRVQYFRDMLQDKKKRNDERLVMLKKQAEELIVEAQ